MPARGLRSGKLAFLYPLQDRIPRHSAKSCDLPRAQELGVLLIHVVFPFHEIKRGKALQSKIHKLKINVNSRRFFIALF